MESFISRNLRNNYNNYISLLTPLENNYNTVCGYVAKYAVIALAIIITTVDTEAGILASQQLTTRGSIRGYETIEFASQ